MIPAAPVALLLGAVAVPVGAVAVLLRRVRRGSVVVTVDGSSMVPALRDGDVVLVRRCGAAGLLPGRLVVVECPVPPAARPNWSWPDADEPPERRRWMVKRLAALPGQPWPPSCTGRGGTVPDGAVAVLGDNPAASTDSRQMGAVPVDRVLGVVVRRLAPAGPVAGPVTEPAVGPVAEPAVGPAVGPVTEPAVGPAVGPPAPATGPSA
ncbi:S26 family signal peptidase [Kitasatospora sp. NPDC057198]|uniref:S26 family signal peptidase n=1 Tax=Kitasatospora sp. NPDC057198 TaxID=3346046 RepID=UPI003629601B